MGRGVFDRDGHRFVVLQAGLACSLGLDAATASAAACAGLTRAQPLEEFVLMSDDGAISGIAAHCAPLITDGYEGYARLLRLLQAGLSDLMRQAEFAAHDRVGFFLCMPDPVRRFGTLELLADPALRADYERRQIEDEAPMPIEKSTSMLLSHAARLVGWRGEPELRHVDTTGHTGVARALSVALAELEAGRVETAVVGGVDSLIGERTLQWLNDCGRLKTPAVAAGLQPAEAAALFCVQRVEARRVGEQPHIGVITGLQFARDDEPLSSGQPATGHGLAQALMAIGVVGEWRRDTASWIVGDHNGEVQRAHDWGMAAMRLRSVYPDLGALGVWTPAEWAGDTAGASGAVALIFAINAMRRRLAPADAAVILSSSDGPWRSAIGIASPSLH